MKKQGGFTLIELVVVIVILGILAVTAAPRFLNLQSDARESSLQGLKGAMAGAGSIVYGKAAIEGIERDDSGTLPAPDNTAVVFGYPAATSAGIVSVVQGLEDPAEWVYTDSTDGLVATFATTESSAIETSNCYVEYVEAENSASTPTITVTDTGC
ncbi:MSHA biogenesis protein MshA [Vibrio breoganii]|uniref:type II secretion system protein n=1 Tax=Vibrio breoganii TaxID=553239 RepID=UPI000C85E1CC|nr:prepilin-type N-terminal cleavage/methylation domain-containing protein [Vibrio breoganii]PMG79732.1 MSHA biogenesis protein MshA [Vibrio breoganii]PMK43092.1 MSHA biogenesis protein MshA [Vibrio breoganii]